MADDAPSELLSRRHQMFPVLSDAEIMRMQRFGTLQTHGPGTRLTTADSATPVTPMRGSPNSPNSSKALPIAFSAL